jgi:hypothetical protein
MCPWHKGTQLTLPVFVTYVPFCGEGFSLCSFLPFRGEALII